MLYDILSIIEATIVISLNKVLKSPPMTEKGKYSEIQPRNISSIKLEEQEQYCNVPGWRIMRKIFYSSYDLISAYNRAEANKLALVISSDNPGYQLVWDKYDLDSEIKISIKDRKPGSFGLPVFLLEPLTDECVQQIDNASKLIRPDDLKQLFS